MNNEQLAKERKLRKFKLNSEAAKLLNFKLKTKHLNSKH